LSPVQFVVVRTHEDGSRGVRVYIREKLYDTVAIMREVKVESLEKLETQVGQMRLSANAGSLCIVFPQEVWQDLLSGAPIFAEPTHEELEVLDHIERQLESYADEESFGTVFREVPCGGSGLKYNLVLRPAGLFAMTTGYYFAPIVEPELVAEIGAGLEGDDSVEQAYIVGAIADDAALLSGDDNLRVLSVRGRSCSISHFEMPPELWQVLSGGLGWRDVQTTAKGR